MKKLSETFEWIIDGSDRWAVLQSTDSDGTQVLLAQRGTIVWTTYATEVGPQETPAGAHGGAMVVHYGSEDIAVSEFYGDLSHYQEHHAATVQAQWTDAEVAAL